MKVVIGMGRWMLNWAVEAVSPVIGGCAGFLVGQVAGPQIGDYAGRGVRSAIDCFGRRIADAWVDRFKTKSPAEQQAAVEELAALNLDDVRLEVAEAIEKFAPDASPEDKALAIDYLVAIPQTVARTLVRDRRTGKATMPAGLPLDDPRTFLHMLPIDVPPYSAPCALPDTAYRLEELIGIGGFGAVYRATDPKLPYLPLAIKFCLDPSMVAGLKQERGNLERLIKAGGGVWSSRVVRLYGYDLEHRTPFLVYEYVPGGDLARFVADGVAAGQRPTAEQVYRWMLSIAEGLAFAHQNGMVHRDLKPANVLLAATLAPLPGAGESVRGMELKIADFGIGGPVANRAIQSSRIGTLSANQLSLAEQASLLRGSGTPLYMSPEQRRGEAPDPRHDIYSLGVMWYQLLLGDCGRELHPGWAEELVEEAKVPAEHVDLIRQCVGLQKKRPADAGELLARMRGPGQKLAPVDSAPPPVPRGRPSRQLFDQVAAVRALHRSIADHSGLTIAMRFHSVGIGSVSWLAIFTLIFMPIMAAMGGFERHGPDPTFLVPITLFVLFGAVFAARAIVRRYQTRQIEDRTRPYRRQLEIEADLLANAFPDDVRSWGGREALFEPMQVEKIYRRMQLESNA